MCSLRHVAVPCQAAVYILVFTLSASYSHAQTFVDRTDDLGLAIGNGPAAFGDVNGDGWPDLYAGGAVWLNNKGTAFTRIDAQGYGLIADLNNDGLGDLVSISPPAIAFAERHEGVIRFNPIPLPELPSTVCRGAAAADFNNDGFVDLYIGGYEAWEKQITYPDLLLINQQGTGFVVVQLPKSFRARGVTACDFDEDADVDIYVSNYRLQPNLLWVNDGHASFTDSAEQSNAIATSQGFGGGHSIGACWGDFDSDGHIDLFAGSFAHNDSRGDQPKSRFLRNMGNEHEFVFEDLGECGVWYQESYASPASADFDNDGHLDLYFTIVYANASFGKKNHPVLYRNQSTTDAWVFEDITAGSGLEQRPATYQAAWADVDRDGRIDLVTGGRLYMNTTAKDAHWLQIRLIGDGLAINTHAIGAQVRITLPDGRTLTRQVEVGTGEGNANSPILHFGLGSIAGPVRMVVHWPNGQTDIMRGVKPDRVVDVDFTPAPATDEDE